MPKVKISTDARLDLIDIESYLVEKWNEDVADQFYLKFLQVIEILEYGNVIFERYENSKFRKMLLTKHNTIIYSIDGEDITVVKILQNFQDPEENLKIIIEQ